jgi:hypothetical protein
LNLLFPDRRKLASALVVASQAMDAAFNQNKAILTILVLAVALQMLAYGYGLLDEAIQIFGNLRSQS